MTVVTGMSDKLEAWNLLDDKRFSSINRLGICKRSRAHLLSDLANWENLESDDDFLEERYELDTYTHEIERYERAFSLRESSKKLEEYTNILQPSPPIPIVETAVEPQGVSDIELAFMAEQGRDCALPIIVSKCPEDDARDLLVIKSTSKLNDEIPIESQNATMMTNI